MRLEYFLICDSFAYDGFRDSVSAFNIIQEYPVENFPSATGEMVAVLSFIIDEPSIDNPITATIEVYPPAGESKRFVIDSIGDDRFTAVIQRFCGIPLTKPGDLVFKLLDAEGIELDTHTIQIKSQAIGKSDE